MTAFLAIWTVFTAVQIVCAAASRIEAADDRITTVIAALIVVTVAVSAAIYATFWIAVPANGFGVVTICKEWIR